MDKIKRLRGSFRMGDSDWGGNWVLFWWAGSCSVNLSSNFLLMDGSVFSLCCLTWGQTMVEVMKIMATSFKRFHAHTAYSVSPTLQQATANPCLSQRLLDTHGQVWVSLLWRHFSFLLGAYKFLLIKYQREYNKNVIFLLRKWRQECIMCRYGTKSGVTITGVPRASARSPCDLPPSPTLLYLLQVWDGVVPHPGPHTPVSSLSRWAHS